MLNYKNLLAPQAYLRITTVGMDDVDGYVVCVVLVVLSLVSLFCPQVPWPRYATATVRSVTPAPSRKKLFLVWLLCGAMLGISLLPHIGLRFLKCGLALLPTTFTLGNFTEILFRAPHFIKNTLLYTLLAAGFDIILGAAIAFLLLRSRLA